MTSEELVRKEKPNLAELDQERVTAIYNRNAFLYDFVDAPMEAIFFRRWRHLLFRDLEGDVLEVGVGTGRNLPFYPRSGTARFVAVDIAERMLQRAKIRSERLDLEVDLRLGDLHDLPFQDESFDAVVATTVFCSVAKPLAALRELQRVLKPGGQLRLLEHQRPPGRLLGRLFDLLNPLILRLSGANINRATDANVTLAGFGSMTSRKLGPLGIVRLITARRQLPDSEES